MKVIALLILALAFSLPVDAKQPRSTKAKADFVRVNPCPSTGSTRLGGCVGYVIDHRVPLCAGGVDRPENMQWMTIPDAKAKDRIERAQCREMRR
ncbi:MAG: HNH endonuclease [Sulfuricaulis sp.]|nr:HNH endonuclease [Sulfuricaulis sp.]